MVGCEQSGCAIPARQFKGEKKQYNENFQGVLMMHFSLCPAPQP